MDARKYLISAFGFSESERRVLKSIFRLTRARAYSYDLINQEERITPDEALVDGDDPEAVRVWRRFCELHDRLVPAVIVMKAVPSESEHVCISRPLTMKKILGALEKVASQARNHVQDGGHADASDHVLAEESVAGAYKVAALVVDDSLPVRKFMEGKLATSGLPVDIDFAASGEQAIALAEARRYDIIFLDVILPGMDGYRVCKSIKAGKSSRNTPIVMLTSKKSPFDRVKGAMAGCEAYLTKPPNEKRLAAIIHKHLLKGDYSAQREESAPEEFFRKLQSPRTF